MNLTVFDASTLPLSPGGGARAPRILFGAKGGININGSAAEMMGIKAGDRIAFAQDSDDASNWYAYKSKDGYELRLHSDKVSYQFNNSAFCKMLKECFGMPTNQSAKFLIAGKPTVHAKVQYWGLVRVGA